jgi:hypothetical protein
MLNDLTITRPNPERNSDLKTYYYSQTLVNDGGDDDISLTFLPLKLCHLEFDGFAVGDEVEIEYTVGFRVRKKTQCSMI